MTSPHLPFDAFGPLPSGPLLLEASAGTGKTYTIAALAARFIAEAGVPVSRLLLITFGNHAAAELRSRLFQRLVASAEDLETHLADGNLPADPTSRHLATGNAALHLERLRTALAEFDQAEVSTIHAFCEMSLASLGVLGDWDAGEQLLADATSLIEECASDVYLSRYRNATQPELDPKRAIALARSACTSTLPLLSHDEEPRAYCEAVRTRFAARKRQLGIATFDDLPARLRALVEHPTTGEAACRELRRRYAVVLVDEFQDTDPDQWAIIDRVFVSAGAPTVLIGDPKQSIYGFRNADLLAYLEAAARTQEQRTLPTNFRSDAALVTGVGELFGTLALGHPSITLPAVGAERGDHLRTPGASPARIWVRGGTASGDQSAEAMVDADLVAHVRYLLAQASIEEPAQPARPVLASDITVLVRTRERGSKIVRSLQTAGIPAMLTGNSGVLSGEAARHWLTLLSAVATPSRSTVMMAAMTDLVGLPLDALLAADGEALSLASALVHRLGTRFATGGVAALTAGVVVEQGLAERLLPLPDGERRLTDLLHVAELLEREPVADVARLADQLAHLIAEAQEQTIETSLRAATDQPAVRVATMHSAKGLEFPVVLLPQVSHTDVNTRDPFPVVADTGERRLYVGRRPGRNEPITREFARQTRDEELRLLYVGLTRARHLAVAWHVMEEKKPGRGDQRVAQGALTALLARDRSVPELAESYPRLPDGLSSRFDPALVDLAPIGTGVPESALPPSPAPAVDARAVSFNRRIDQTWRRTSYSGLTAGLHETEHRGQSDEPAELDLVAPTLVGDLTLPSPWADLPAGAGFGTLVHEAFEVIDWAPAHLADDATRLASHLAPGFGLDAGQAERLAAALVAACTTSLGPLTGGAQLSDIPLASRLPELDFDLPLGNRGAPATVQDLAALMAAHLPADDPLVTYPAQLAASGAAPAVFNGFLTGSIDAVLQLPSGGFVVVDYKTNRLPTLPGEWLAAGHYQPRAMAQAMMAAHYPLQALLYSAALHRFLQWRHPGYAPERHLAGVGYLFVRGMAGPGTPTVDGHPCGVFEWHPPVELVLATSTLLGGHDAQA